MGKIFGPSFLAAPSSQLIITLSKSGITSDAPNGLEWGVTAQSGTGQEAAINALFTAAVAQAAVLGVVGVKVIWDVACTLSGPVFLKSNMTIEAPHYGCGAIMRSGADSPIFMVDGMQANMNGGAYTGVGATATQKTFGKFDPAQSGAAHPEYYRVFDAAYVNANNIAILGGTWNGYYAGQTTQPPGTQAGLPFIVRLNIGYTSIMHFFGVNGLYLKALHCFNGTHFGLNFCNVGNATIEDCDVDQLQDRNYGSDAFHFGGPCQNIRIINPRTHCADDNIALNADDLPSTAPGGEGIVCGANWQCSGAITDVLIRNHIIWNGRENVLGWGGPCFRSSYNRIDRIIIDGISGVVASTALWAPNINGVLVAGPGNVGHVTINNASLDLVPGLASGPIHFQTNAEFLEITNRYRRSAQNSPDIVIDSACTIGKLVVDNYTAYQPPAAPNQGQTAVLVKGTVKSLRMSASVSQDASVATYGLPLISVTSTGTVQSLLLDADVVGSTNLVQNAGTIGTAVLRGLHLNSNGGSPIANSGTVANLVTKQLAYNSSTLTPYSGTAPGTFNQLGDGGTPLAVPGAPTGLIAGTPTPTSVPLSWTAPTSGGGVSGYLIGYRVTSVGGAFTTASTGSATTTGTVTGLTAGTQYDFEVIASNAAGNGAASSVVSATTAAAGSNINTALAVPAGGSFVTGKFGSALTGNTATATITNPSGALTMECWIKMTAGTSAYATVFNTSTGQQGIIVYGGTIDWVNSGTVFHSASNVADGAWHHVALVYNPSNTSAPCVGYIDGVQDAVNTTVTNFPSNVGIQVCAANQTTMAIDEPAIFNYAKYTGAFTPPTSPYTTSTTGIIACWHLDGSGASI